MDTYINRVYVNPNFNRVHNRAICPAESLYSNNNLYVNPNFTRNITDVQQSSTINRKIYVNPTFIKMQNVLERNRFLENREINNIAISSKQSNSILKGYSSATQYSNTQHKISKAVLSENISICPSSKSRYRLIRKNDIQPTKVAENHRYINESCTIKVNKYKSIPLKHFRNNLQNMVKNEDKPISPKSNVSPIAMRYVNKNCFKLVRYNLKSTISPSLKSSPKCNPLKIKRNMDLKLQLKLKVPNILRRKNNVPCRLFTKYGKCLRNLCGTCDYLHDKKHVSLCRKFIKGICHDKQCLLSHELSSKKMPTCYFYLKGMCTKKGCPYLHVKLNEKSKICHDFLKGYCDKGDKCLQRHVQQKTDKKNDKKRYTLNKHSSNKIVKTNNSKSIKTNQLKRIPECKNNKINLENGHNNKSDSDCRYFKDSEDKETMCEILKPTRCKLGTLPSFIRL